VLVMAVVGYGSVLLLVSCASLRSNGWNMAMLKTGFRGFGSVSCAQVLYDFYDGVMDGWNGRYPFPCTGGLLVEFHGSDLRGSVIRRLPCVAICLGRGLLVVSIET